MSLNSMLVDKINKEWTELSNGYQTKTALWLIDNASEIDVKKQIADVFISEIEDLGFDDTDKMHIYHSENVINTVYDYYISHSYDLDNDYICEKATCPR